VSLQRIAVFAAVLLVVPPIGAVCTVPSFSELPVIPTGNIFNGNLATGDINRDGFVDFVVPSDIGDDVRVFFGNGDGTFDPHVAYPVADAGVVAVHDVNKDQWPDIVVNHGNTSLGVMLNNGNGTFAPVASITTTLHLVQSISVADFNGDGYADLLITDFDGPYINIFWNDGAGAFPTRNEWAGLVLPGDAVTSDFNADGKSDFAVVSGFSTDAGKVSIYLNPGNGNFPATASHTYDMTAPGLNSTYDLAVGDFDGNGRPDLIASKYTGFKSFLVTPTGSFNNGQSQGMTPSDFMDVAAGDFNEDGKIDAVFAGNNGAVMIARGLGTGSFSTPYWVTQNGQFHMTDVKTADLDNDGRPDFMILDKDGFVRLFRNTCNSRFAIIGSLSSENPATYPETITFQISIVPRGGTITPTGTVSLSHGNTSLGTQPLLPINPPPRAAATFTINLKPGVYSFAASYPGDSNYQARNTSYTQTIKRPYAGPPLEVVANGSGSQIVVQWIGTESAGTYDILRLNNGSWETIANTPNEVYLDPISDTTKPYVYAVRTRSATNVLSAISNADVANTFAYTSSPLALGAPVKAVDVNQLRSMVNGLRTTVGLTPYAFSDTIVPGSLIKRLHIAQLREALETALAAVAIGVPSYSQPVVTFIRRADQQELRNAMN
jgi:Bacterial Ig-like domain (group 3)/FG-GAP-like repeat